MDRFNRELKRIYNGWIYTNWILVIAYPIALIHMIVFWCLNVNREHARARNWDILASHFLGITMALTLLYFSIPDSEMDADTQDGYMILMCISFGMAAVFKICGNAARKSKVRLLMTYATLVMEDENVQTVQDLGNRVGRNYAKVTSAFDFLVRIGMPAERDLHTGQISLLADTWYLDDGEANGDETEEYEEDEEPYEEDEEEYDEDDVEEDEGYAAASREKPVLMTVECSGCGAKSQMYLGDTKTCEYCGTTL